MNSAFKFQKCRLVFLVILLGLGVAVVPNADARLMADDFLPYLPGKWISAEQVQGSSTEEKAPVYIVEKGDTLWEIAKKYQLAVQDLIALNNIAKENVIYPGQVLKLQSSSPEKYRHVVQKGDTVWRIAHRYKVEIKEIITLNALSDPSFLRVGTSILIPLKQVPVLSSRQFSPPEFQWPLIGPITSPFGMRSSGMHHGMDIAGEIGDPIRAARSGLVVFTGWRSVYGRTVMIDHGNEYSTLYGHISEIKVTEGEWVREGELIATVGNTGRSTGPHLHFEVRFEDQAVNPAHYLP